MSSFTNPHIRQSPRSQTHTFINLHVHKPTHSSVSRSTNLQVRQSHYSHASKFVGLHNSKHLNSSVSTLYASMPLHSSFSVALITAQPSTIINHESVLNHQQRESSLFTVLFIRFLILHDPCFNSHLPLHSTLITYNTTVVIDCRAVHHGHSNGPVAPST